MNERKTNFAIFLPSEEEWMRNNKTCSCFSCMSSGIRVLLFIIFIQQYCDVLNIECTTTNFLFQPHILFLAHMFQPACLPVCVCVPAYTGQKMSYGFIIHSSMKKKKKNKNRSVKNNEK